MPAFFSIVKFFDFLSISRTLQNIAFFVKKIMIKKGLINIHFYQLSFHLTNPTKYSFLCKNNHQKKVLCNKSKCYFYKALNYKSNASNKFRSLNIFLHIILMPSKSIEQLTLKHFLYYPQLTSKYVDGN